MIVPSVEKIDLQNSNFGAAEEMNVTGFGDTNQFNRNIPNFSSGNKTENTTENNLNKKVYYEVGCKIFEINKIYK
jgi:hypothetical protein